MAASTVPGWEDIVPIPQDDGPNPVVSIAYATPFRELMDIFRAVLASGELSERVLQLTEDLLELNPANYTIWQYRRQVLFHLNLSLSDELDYMDTFAEENPKNYQIWFHRRAVIEKFGDASRELGFTSTVFQVDAKNYHAWSHRQWVISSFNLWEGEVSFVELLLQSDIRNNSAWNQRWFAQHSSQAFAFSPMTESILESDIEYTFQSLKKAPTNESAWNYLHGLRTKYQSVFPMVITLNLIDRLIDMLTLFDREGTIECSYLLEHVADIWVKEQKLVEAADLFERLIQMDQIRGKYWEKRMRECRGII